MDDLYAIHGPNERSDFGGEPNALKRSEDPSSFVDLSDLLHVPEIRDQVEILFKKTYKDPQWEKTVQRIASEVVSNGKRTIGTQKDSSGEQVTYSSDDLRTYRTLRQEGVPNTLKYLREIVSDCVHTITGERNNRSLKQILQSNDYESSELHEMIDALRLLPVYRKILNLLEVRWKEMTSVTKQIDALYDKKYDGTVTDLELAELQRLESTYMSEPTLVSVLKELGLQQQADTLLKMIDADS